MGARSRLSLFSASGAGKEKRNKCAEKGKAPRERGSWRKKNMNRAKFCILITLFFSTSQGKNHYTVSSIEKLRINLRKYHKVIIKRRWVFACIRWLLDCGYLARKQRFTHDGDGRINQISSMVSFRLKGVAWLVSKGVVGAKQLYKSMVKWIQKEDGRFPQKGDLAKPKDEKMFRPDRADWDKLLGIVTKNIT